MPKIKRLSEHIINQIKAGEVVERPSSVVKELLENSLDAGATKIQIELIDGGKQLIRISDNGFGIDKDDLALALERHATSKLSEVSDLEKLNTLGFRGEAIPSISAVSNFSIRSKVENSDRGYEITAKNGNISKLNEISMNKGTIITVKDLFFNVPARQKFLRSTATEFAHINDFCTALALIKGDISFKLIHNSREVFVTKSSILPDLRLKSLFPTEADEFFSFEKASSDLHISGFASFPHFAKSIPRVFITFVNNRYVKDKIIRAGIMQAYSSIIARGLIPSFIAFLKIPPQWLDVNVHPAKTELRFSDPLLIQDLIARNISEAIKEQFNKDNYPMSKENLNDENQKLLNKEYYHNVNIEKKPYIVKNTTFTNLFNNKQNTDIKEVKLYNKNNEISPKKDLNDKMDVKKDEQINILENVSLCKEITNIKFKYLGQFINCYLLVEVGTELWIIDQHAFHERILYEELTQKYNSQAMPKQELIVPLLLSVPVSVASLLDEYKEQISNIGFNFDILNNGELAITALPTIVQIAEALIIFDEIIAKIIAIADINLNEAHPIYLKAKMLKNETKSFTSNITSLNIKGFYHLLFATIACHSAIRQGDAITNEMADYLLKRAKDVDFFNICPHGRPVLRKFNKENVETWFMRI